MSVQSRKGTVAHSLRQSLIARDAWRRIKAGEGFLYVAEIVGTDTVKIGFSLNPQRRIGDCACFYSRRPRRLLATMPGSIQAERELHKALINHRIQFDRCRRPSEVYPRSILNHALIPAALREQAA